MASTAAVQAICGPVGSGKTRTNFTKHIQLASRQQPSPRRRINGRPVRMYKLTVVRDTYRNLEKTTLPSWFKMVPKETGKFVGAANAPGTHEILFELGDGTVVEFKVDFVAMGDLSAEDALGGYETTAFFLNEGSLLNPDVFTFARPRAGRYPDMADGGPTWRGVTLDMNSPELGNWAFDGIRSDDNTPASERFDGFFGRLPPGFAFFQQPSGFSTAAENLMNLPFGYYEQAAVGQPRWYVARMIECKPGYSRSGKPVYPEFDDERHVAGAPLVAVPRRQLIVGLDAGLSPAAAFNQIMPGGQWRTLAELVCEPGVGARRFGQRLSQLLAERFPEHLGSRSQTRPGLPPLIQGWADPSAINGVDKQAGEADWIQIVSREAGIRILPAPSNNVTKRTEAVRVPLARLMDGEPGYLIDPECTVLRKGFNAGYRFKQVRAGGETKNLAEIDKNAFSHPHDALQYALLGGGTDYDAAERRERLYGGRRQVTAIDGDHPDGEWA